MTLKDKLSNGHAHYYPVRSRKTRATQWRILRYLAKTAALATGASLLLLLAAFCAFH